MRPNTVCLSLWEFASLPNESEFEGWLVDSVFGDQKAALERVVEGFKFLNIDEFKKRFLLTFETKEQAEELLSVFDSHGYRGVLWPGLGREVRVRATSMEEITMEILVMNVAAETDVDLVRRTLEKFGKVKRCERLRMTGGMLNRVQTNKVKVEIVRNSVTLPNIIHAFGTSVSADDFLTWKLQYRGSPRYCYGCGATSHEARHCRERGITREGLEKVKSVVGEEEQAGDEVLEDQEVPKLSYAAVVKDHTFLEKQRQERLDLESKKAAEEEEQTKKIEEEAHLARAEEILLQKRVAETEGEQQQQQEGEQELSVVKEVEVASQKRDDGKDAAKDTENFAEVKKDGSLVTTTKRPAPAPSSPSPKEKAQRVGSKGGYSEEEEGDNVEEDEEDEDSEEAGSQEGSDVEDSVNPITSEPGPQGPPAELGQGVRYTTASQQDGGSQPN